MLKKRIAKGILAAAMAFTTILGASQYAKSENMIVAHAACSHNYRHYAYKHSSWCANRSTNIACRTVYTKCVNCGGDRGSYKEYKTVDSSFWKMLDDAI